MCLPTRETHYRGTALTVRGVCRDLLLTWVELSAVAKGLYTVTAIRYFCNNTSTYSTGQAPPMYKLSTGIDC